jgi:uncharacterized repeat protein (TIGR03847 family)
VVLLIGRERRFEVPPARNELGKVAMLNASSVGIPGERYFCLTVEAEYGKACFWLEKEQLFNLAMAAKHLLDAEVVPENSQPDPVPDPNIVQGLEFRVGELNLAQEQQTGLFRIMVKDFEQDEDESTAAFLATAAQLENMSSEALKVCAGGRPRCALCGSPIGPDQHICVRSNGHAAASKLQ